MATSHIRNPFIVAGEIPPHLFCDRKDESARLIRDITNGNNLVLISSRRMGKTGLINHCFKNSEIKDHYETFYIDILQTSSLREFTYLLGKEIFSRLASRNARALKKFVAVLRSIAGSFGFDALTGTPTFAIQLGDIKDPDITIDEIFRFLAEAETPSIVAIDEFQQIANYKEHNVEALLRSHIQRLPHTNFVFAGSERHLLMQMFNESARPFFNIASFLQLNPIGLPVYADFTSSLFMDYGKSIDRQTVKYVYDSFEGNTFYLQKTFNLAFSKTPAHGECNISLINESIAEILSSYDTLYREILSRVGEQQKQLLISIAKEGNASGITSSKFIRKHSLSSASSVQAAAKRLLESNMITRQESTYSVQDPLLRMWLLHTY